MPDAAPPNTTGETRQERLRRQRVIPSQRVLIASLYDVWTLVREARVPLIGFALVMLSGTIYLMVVRGYDVFAALFATMTMLLLEQDEPFPDDVLGRILFFAIPILGLMFVFQGVLDFAQRLLDKSSRLEAWQVSLAHTQRDHIIVCGLGRVSYRVMLQLLDAGYEVVVVEVDWEGEFVSEALLLRVPVIHGDARDPQVLHQAGITRARGLLAGISNDLRNIEVGLAARRIKPDLHVVLRIFSERLDLNLESSRFGKNSAFSSSALAAPTLAAAAVCRGIKYALPIADHHGDHLLGISEVVVTPNGQLDDLVHKIEERFQVQVVAYTGQTADGKLCWRHAVSPDARLYGGDRVLLLGTLQALGEAWSHGRSRNHIMETLGMRLAERPTSQHSAVIVCGLGRVGFRVVQVLHQIDPRPEIVVICETSTTRERFIKEVRGLGATIINGDARTEEVLLSAGIQRAYAVVAITSDNLTNLHISLSARHLRSDVHVVLRVFQDVLAEQLEAMFGIHTAFSTSALSAPTLSAAAVSRGTGYAIDVGEHLMSTARLKVQRDDEFAGRTIYELREQQGMIIVSLRRGKYSFLMPHDPAHPGMLFTNPLQADDEIVVLADIQRVAALRERGAVSEDIGARITRRLPSITRPLTETLTDPQPNAPASAPAASSPVPRLATGKLRMPDESSNVQPQPGVQPPPHVKAQSKRLQPADAVPPAPRPPEQPGKKGNQ